MQIAASALVLAIAGPVVAQSRPPPAFPPYPAVRSLPAVADWLRRYSDIPQARLVGLGPDSLFAVEPAPQPGPPPGLRTIIRQEAVTPEFAKRLGGRSASMVADIDCQGRRVFQREVDLYVGSNRQGASRRLGAAKDWQAIPPGTYMEQVMQAVCDPQWRAPYAAAPPQTPAVAVAAARPAPFPDPASRAVQRPAVSPPVASENLRAELGRYDSTEAALAAWRAAAPAAPGARLRIELAVAGGRTQYRALVEGFTGRAEAEAFCRSLQSADATCAVLD
jgi:hypothetical protein